MKTIMWLLLTTVTSDGIQIGEVYTKFHESMSPSIILLVHVEKCSRKEHGHDIIALAISCLSHVGSFLLVKSIDHPAKMLV
jgi:hypothetical protein